jgi:2-keto-4-pentenoate hydratase
MLRLADQLLHGSLVVGTGIPWHGSFDWKAQAATVSRNGKVVVETTGAHPLGDPTYLLGWLAAHAAERGVPLDAGDIVTAGTWTGVYDAVAGDTIDVDFPGVGRATAVFE